MKSAVILFSILSLFLLSARSYPVLQSATDIVRKADERMRGKTSKGDITIQIVRPAWKRELKIKSWTKGTTQAVLYVTYPAREKGTVYLKREKEVWNWIPAIERTIKLPPSMMSQSWMGTDFTNDDLVKESSVVDDYMHSIVGDTVIGDRSCYKIQLVPKPSTAVVWGKILLWIDKKDYLELRAEFFDEDGSKISTMESSEIKMIAGRLIPTRSEMIPADKPGQRTVMIYNNIVFDEPIDDSFFSPENMKKIK